MPPNNFIDIELPPHRPPRATHNFLLLLPEWPKGAEAIENAVYSRPKVSVRTRPGTHLADIDELEHVLGSHDKKRQERGGQSE